MAIPRRNVTKPIKSKPTAVLTSDWHIRPDVPECRTDDFQEAQWRKVQFVLDLAKQYSIPIVLGGDISGNSPQWPNWLLERFSGLVRASGVRILAIPGQHDLPGHNWDRWRESGYGVLVSTGVIVRFYHEAEISGFLGYGIPFGRMGEEDLGRIEADLLVLHVLTLESRKMEWEQDQWTADGLLDSAPNVRCILTGDNHKPFVRRLNGRLLVNPGSLMRTKSDQIDHRPRVYLWHAEENEVVPVYIPIEQGVVSREAVEKRKDFDERQVAYVERLKKGYEIGLSYEDNLKDSFVADPVDTAVAERVWDAVEEGRAMK